MITFVVTSSLVVPGIPGDAAVGIDVTHMAGKSMVAATTHLHRGGLYE